MMTSGCSQRSIGFGRLIGAAAGLAALLAGAPAAAATYFGSVQSGSTVSEGSTATPMSYALGGGSDSASVVLLSDSGGSILARSSVLTSETGFGGRGVISFTVRLDGPDGAPVPVTVRASGYADGTGIEPVNRERLYFAAARFVLADEFNIEAITNAGDGRQILAVDRIVMFRPNVDYAASIEARAGSFLYLGIANTAEAFVDPSFTVDPAFASLYRITGVPTASVPPVGGVPEPATWAMFVVGFGLVGGVVRRRRPAHA